MTGRIKKHKQDLKADAFRDKGTDFIYRLSDKLEGRGSTILYALGALALVGVLLIGLSAYNRRQEDKAQAALGRAIDISTVRVTPSPAPTPAAPNSNLPIFTSERERAERAVKEFEAVADSYGKPYSEIARYFAATNKLPLDRNQAINELQSLTGASSDVVAANARFALAQAREADGQYDQAANLYNELLKGKNGVYPPDTLNLRLANILDKQGKRDEAAELLFRIVKEARERKNSDGKFATASAASRDAAQKLEELDPARYAQLPPEPPPANPFM